jgi:hypothetical protein
VPAVDSKQLAAGMEQKIAAESQTVTAVIHKHCKAQGVDPTLLLAYMLQKLQHTHKIIANFGPGLCVHDEIEAILNLRQPAKKPPASILATIDLTAQMQAETDARYARQYNAEPVGAVLEERVKVANALRQILKEWMHAAEIPKSTARQEA